MDGRMVVNVVIQKLPLRIFAAVREPNAKLAVLTVEMNERDRKEWFDLQPSKSINGRTPLT